MKRNKALSFLSITFFATLALVLIANVISAPVSVSAQARATATKTRAPRPTPRPTLTKGPTTETATVSPTVTETPEQTATFTVTNTFTITPSPTFTPTSTPTATATAFPSMVRLNELLTFAKFKDWNKDERLDNNDQWIELHNASDHPVDVSGWSLDTGPKTPSFLLPNGSTIPAGGFLLYFRKQTQLDLDHYEHLRLLYPDGSLADQVIYPPLPEDRVYARNPDGSGAWRTGCVPSPLAKNCLSLETYTNQFNLPFFEQHIVGPEKALDMQVLVTNILLAIILALAIGFFSNLLNDALETHEEDVAKVFGPFTRLLKKIGGAFHSFNRILSFSRFQWIGFLVKFIGILFIYGAVLAFLDPNFRLITQDGFMLIVALGLSTGFIALADDLALYLYLRARGAGGEIRFHSANFLLVAASTLVSRVTGIVPGLFLGSPAGIEDVPREHSGPKFDILAILVTAAFGAVAWLLIPRFASDPWLNTLLLLMFAAGVQTTFFEMLPISYLRGRGIYNFSRVVWALLFTLAASAFLQTMLNPDGIFLGAFQSRNMVLLSLFVIAYCLFCTLIWYWLTRLARQREQEQLPTDSD